MSDKVVSVEGIGKKYQIGTEVSGDLRYSFANGLRNLFGKSEKTEFWAVKDINFDLLQGEALGIIGHNGAGKSTLLKILSRITFPTTGRFTIEGRVSSLIEVGTGFHPELSGRENIFLNGTILGMTRQEVRSKLDEIIAFSGVEQFIDTPVKHYSSGMKVRLAFAVAAHLEPEVLIVDEVLAVGDVEFQRKCLSKMKDVTGHGRTILFVSHNMSAVNSLCNRCILLDHGQVVSSGDPKQLTSEYLNKNSGTDSGEKDLSYLPIAKQDAGRFDMIRWIDEAKNTIDHARVTDRFALQLDYQVLTDGFSPEPVVLIYSASGEELFTSFADQKLAIPKGKGKYTATVWFPADLFNAETLYVSLWLCTWLPHTVHQVAENVTSLRIMDDLESVTKPPSYARLRGPLRPALDWEFDQG